MNTKVPHHPGSPFEGFADHGALMVPPSPDEILRFTGVSFQLADGQIFVAATRFPTPQIATLMRFTADGSIDQSFGTDGVVPLTEVGRLVFSDAVIQADGHFLFYGIEGVRVYLVRVTPEGALDPDFGEGGIASVPIPAGARLAGKMALLPDNKIMIYCSADRGTFLETSFLRFMENGELDLSFGDRGVVPLTPAELRSALIVQGEHIIAAGDIDRKAMVAKYRLDGSLETTFGNQGYATFAPADQRFASLRAITIQDDGKLMAVGHLGLDLTNPGDALVLRLNSDGTFDDEFNNGEPYVIGLRVNCENAEAVHIQTDGKIMVGGRGPGPTSGVLFRLEPSGAVDRSFGYLQPATPDYQGWIDMVPVGAAGRIHRLVRTVDGNLLVSSLVSIDGGPFERILVSKYYL